MVRPPARGYSRENIQGDGKGASYNSRRGVKAEQQPANETSSSREMRPARPAATGEIQYHKVQRGETLQSIATACGTSVELLCKLNGIGPYTRVSPGDLLKYQAN